ncbi:AzlD domain-containing protein [Lacticaseibacillus pantheris]|uniref:AzlD domain-containing protein n=1 Tax=Lacticaseibacillus pantheris TaxID=171523 RepID=UPI0007052811|nr:AzlD domain-containing protein [Lacticaseibacillus pantheris]
MPSFEYSLLVVIGCGVVTWLCRVIPFILLKKWRLPAPVLEFLSFVPVSIMAALVVSSLFTQHLGRLPTLNVPYAIATIPSVVVAVVTRSLLAVAVVGIAALAITRLLM